MTKGDLDFLSFGGEMGARMRAFDWLSTPLGGPSEWPQSLKTIVRVMLDSRFAMWMLWGKAGTFFCNDAYLPTVGIRREWVLGARADRVWAEIWHDIGPRIEHVLSTGQATWDDGLQLFLERSGYPEETFHTFSYSPVYDDENRVAGMLCVVAEETQRVIGDRRLRLLQALASLPTAAASSVREAAQLFVRALEHDGSDVPMAALYLTDAPAESVRRVAATPSELERMAPMAERIDQADSPWHVGLTIGTGLEHLIEDFDVHCASVAGAWPEPVRQALVLPLMSAGHTRALGAVLLGISTRRAYDENYRSFLSLVAAQIASGLADVQARLDERQRAQALAELDRAKNMFFSNVSHEFRTPLTLMLGPIESLLEDPDLPRETQESLVLVRRNGLRMRKLVNSLLEFSRVEAGRIDANFRATDLMRLTRELAGTFRGAVEHAGLRLEVHCEEFPTDAVYVDRDLWEKIVLNLISNAFKFTFEGEIRVNLAKRGEFAELSVSDTGIGIEASELSQIFDRFHRVSGARSRSDEGSGIGLALVRELVRLHGGSVHAQSEVGQGTTFCVRIPLGSAHLPQERIDTGIEATDMVIDADAYIDEALRSGSGLSAVPGALSIAHRTLTNTSERARLLVVDDNADMRAYLTRLLEPTWEVAVAANGLEALELLETSRFDLVVTDVMMPHLDGYGLVERIRANPLTQLLPVVVLSAQAGEEARVRGLKHGADDYLVKPFSARELIARIEVQLMRLRMKNVKEAQERRVADVFRDAPVGVALLSGPEHSFAFINPNFQAFLSGRNVLGMPIRQALPELDSRGVFELLDSVRVTGEPYIGRASPLALVEPLHGGGASRYFDFVYQPLRSESGETDGIAIVGFEVTELVLARKYAESANRAKDEFIAMLGHELRNPLAPIVTALELIKKQWPDTGVRERSIIERQVGHMCRLVDDLLDVARITRGGIELRKNVLELGSIVEKAVETTRPLYEQRRQRLDVRVSPSGLCVYADTTRMCQVISNLLANAAKFSEFGGTVTLEGHRDGDTAVVTVQDEGAGMSPEELSTIFDMFVQGGAQGLDRSQGGLGLGLTIARSLTAMHGGSLSAASPGRGHGSLFTLRLPLATALEQGSQVDPVPEPETVKGLGRRVLVVDDNVDAAATLEQLLQSWGFETLLAHDGPTALDVFGRVRVDIALVDIGLPVLSGYEVAKRVRAMGRNSKVRLIALSGYGQQADKARSEASGFHVHLVKPVDQARLAVALA